MKTYFPISVSLFRNLLEGGFLEDHASAKEHEKRPECVLLPARGQSLKAAPLPDLISETERTYSAQRFG